MDCHGSTVGHWIGIGINNPLLHCILPSFEVTKVNSELTWEEILEVCRKTTIVKCLNCNVPGTHMSVFQAHSLGLGYYCQTCGDPSHHLKKKIEIKGLDL